MGTASNAYRDKYAAQLAEWSAKLDVLVAQTQKLTAEAKIDVMPHLEAARLRCDAAKARLHDASDATDATWHTVVRGFDEAWHDVEASVEGAYDAIKARL